MSVEVLPRPVDTDRTPEPVDHYYCPCTPDVAFCGADVSSEPEVSGTESTNLCALCALVDEDNGPCARCGL